MWTLSKIMQFISDGIEENLNLDYKGADSLSKKDSVKKEISKDVSAFANSDGGIIIYGVREFDERDKKHLPEKIDPINGIEYTREWLEQIINSSIHPRIQNIRITPIQTEIPKNNKVIHLVEIPKSNTAHQAQDKKYYRRYNFESRPMEDWEIKDIINRQNKTDIQITLEPRDSKEYLDYHLNDNKNFKIKIDIWAENKGNRVAHYVDCIFTGDSKAAKFIHGAQKKENGFILYYSNLTERKITLYQEEFVINSERNAILPNTSRNIGYLEIDSVFILDRCELKLQVAVEDGSKYKLFKGKEILGNYK